MDDSHPMTIIAINTYELHKTETINFCSKLCMEMDRDTRGMTHME